MEANAINVLQLAMLGMADVLKTPLALVDSHGKLLGMWVFPGDTIEDVPSGMECWPEELRFAPNRLTTIQQSATRRRFIARVGILDSQVFIQSADLPDYHPWLDGKLCEQVLPGLKFAMNREASFLLGLYIFNICQAIIKRSRQAEISPLNDLDIENVRRIGLCLETKIEGCRPRSKEKSFSLGAVPSLEEFFAPSSSGRSDRPDLSETLEHLTTGRDSSFNLMGLSGDFVVEAKTFQCFCNTIARQQLGDRCFGNDLKSLVEATFLGKNTAEHPPTALVSACHAGLFEVVAPVYAFGLVVGTIFGGQLCLSKEQQAKILAPFLDGNATSQDRDALIRVTEASTLNEIKSVVSGISAILGLLTERYAIARSEASLLSDVLLPRQANLRELFHHACQAIKRDLAVQDCSIFLITHGRLVLEATTATKLYVRTRKGEDPTVINSELGIGRAFYELGEGLTGGVAKTHCARFEPNAMEAKNDWVGKCSETKDSAQCFVAPILCDRECIGVLRAVRLTQFPEMPGEQRQLIESLARHLGVGVRYREAAEGDSLRFKNLATELQQLLAEAAHELRAPLHNVLSLSTALRYTSGSQVGEQARLHQKIKEEIYRAKREVDDYLLRGIEGREELKYNFRKGNLNELLFECASRFSVAASKRGMQINIDPSLKSLPQITFDSERLEQVFSNLIDNAIKYSFSNMKEGISVKAKSKANTVTISIVDYGLGIPTQVRIDIFEGYQRAVEDQTVFKPGIGLGLKIARRIVEKHGGAITVESEPFLDDPKRLARHEGYKTTFTVSLPKVPETAEVVKNTP
jgi:signal transduction histidine kinase/ligand-binding sensor protein